MKNPKLQVMVHGDNIALKKNGINIKNYPGVKIERINKVENPNYLFVDLNISSQAKPGTITFTETTAAYETHPKIFDFELKARRPGKSVDFARGVTSRDFIYLIMPDRFSNGDTNNDRVPG
ncbi:MAG: cyclomaltodextrinase N-terminal domain-containing protein, partial [Ginsengibacter sp.]